MNVNFGSDTGNTKKNALVDLWLTLQVGVILAFSSPSQPSSGELWEASLLLASCGDHVRIFLPECVLWGLMTLTYLKSLRSMPHLCRAWGWCLLPGWASCPVAVALLFGWSSAALAVHGNLEGAGIVLKYIMAGYSLFLGNLWDVTDHDIDHGTDYTEALLQG